MLDADRTAGFTSGLDQVPVALDALRRRFLDVTDGLGAEEWGRQSRCELWTVHDVVRHVRDACRIHVGQLRREASFVPAENFDARRTPQRWLDRSAGERPEDTVGELRALSADEAEALADRLEAYTDDVVTGPYGPVHWTILTTHVFWDAWVHMRDVTECLDGGHPSTPVEDGVVALYGLLLASMPAALRGHRFEATVALTSGDGREHLAFVAPGHVTVQHPGGPATGVDLRGDLVTVVDALAGRGPDVELVLHGDPAVREPLTWLRPILAPP